MVVVLFLSHSKETMTYVTTNKSLMSNSGAPTKLRCSADMRHGLQDHRCGEAATVGYMQKQGMK